MVYMIFIFILFLLSTALILRLSLRPRKVAAVVVLGDIGRSPRMQYHSISLANEGYIVYMVGYAGSVPHSDVTENKNIILKYLATNPQRLTGLPRLMQYVIKVIWQAAALLFVLCTIPKPSHILMQNPPALPSMAVCWVVSRVRGSKYVIDWHNYGYTILGLSLGQKHPLVVFSKIYERFVGKLSDYNLCVTNAMRNDLQDNWTIKATTLYDRPPPIFKESSIDERHRLFSRLQSMYEAFSDVSDRDRHTRFTKLSPDGVAHLREDRPVILISSTSWTEDEDFSILLKALEKYETESCHDPTLRDMVCIITGKGPQKDHYMKIISEKKWQNVQVVTPWLEAEDYPTMLSCADIGVCLHTSSSGLDLPMKVVDMFGCGLPVCAINFNCLDELVKHDYNGLVFDSHSQLAQQIMNLVQDFPNGCEKLAEFRKNLQSFQDIRWQDSWKDNVSFIFS